MWPTGKDLLKLCLLIWEWLDYFHLSCQDKYKSRRNSSLRRRNLFILSDIILINLHRAVGWPKTDIVCSPSTSPGRQGHIWAPSESLRTDSWLGWYPVETVLSTPLTWQEPSGQKSLSLVLFQREHIRENTIKVHPSTPNRHGYNGATWWWVLLFLSLCQKPITR